MASYNLIVIAGNLTRDPESRVVSGGTKVTEITLATSKKFRDSQGKDREKTTFVDVTLWGRTAENVAKYCAKGSNVLVQGSLELSQWEDKQSGQKRQKLFITGETVQFLGSPKGRGTGQQQQQGQGQGEPDISAPYSSESPPQGQTPPDDEPPF